MTDRIIELRWNCSDCGQKDILGRHKRCPSCGSPREKGEMQMGGLDRGSYDAAGHNRAATVTDPKLLELATAGYDWFCSHCGSGNKGNGDRCSACGGPRYGEATENHPEIPSTPPSPKMKDIPYSFDDSGIYGESSRTEKESSSAWDRREERERKKSRKMMVYLSVGSLLLLCGVVFTLWALRTHEVQGEVSSLSWTQETVQQRWTQGTVPGWEHQTAQHAEIPPANGEGERAGMVAINGSCHQAHYTDERYVCGSHQECHPKTRTESYSCGESCSDNGNGFATCRPKTCTRSVPDGQTCRQVTDYCTRPIYKTQCNYQTQQWQTIDTKKASGTGTDTSWPDLTPSLLDRLRYRATYEAVIAYHDRGKDKTTSHDPVRNKDGLLTIAEAKAAEKTYRTWNVKDTVVLEINNLGGLHEVRRGALPAEIVTK
jgi:predicted nucleic acid-binding Zn ribbon protein